LNPIDPASPERLLMASSYRKDELEKIVQIRKGVAKPDLSFNRFYWDSEYLSHQRPSFFTSARMFSSRNNNMEIPYNSEGLMNHHYADGSNFISRTGKEYLDISPVFDWQKIPGTTIVQKPSLPAETEIQKEGLTDFVGAVTDGIYGAASFDFRSPHDPLKAKKSWFFFDKEIVCLGAGISAGTDLPVVTTLNQCLLHGRVVAMSGNSKSVLQHGEWQLDKVNWIFHDSIGYLFPDPVTVNLSNQAATGSWYKINHQANSSKEEITKDVFKLWLDHGKRPDSSSYQYIVVPAVGEEEMNSTSGNRGIVILSNSTEIQAVKHLDLSLCQIVFYKSGRINISPSVQIESESPGIVMIKTEGETVKKLSVSDPTRKLARIHVSVSTRIEKNGDHFKAIWDESKKVSEVTIDLPQGVYAGKSITVEF
jgi:chondroitin AC lyase